MSLHSPRLNSMDIRQQKLLKIIIKEYIKTAEPISSGLLVQKFRLPYSPATVRAELVKLEEEGYIHQPHTSAGRVPTEKAYQFYVENFLSAKKQEMRIEPEKNNEDFLKQTAKTLAAKSGLAVFWAVDHHNLYYTGIANLLSQPEFMEAPQILNISRIIDDIEDIIVGMYSGLTNKPQIFIGRKNPFGAICGSVVVKYEKNGERGMFGIVGPMRMDYEQCLGLVEYIKNNLK
ncbi:hypothetical protein COT99_01830 [Candidatus Falkowbacteria bacterium CG10_big_fil_rev_8_21_14_0_10_43_10]|uniref:Heat-inducible transcription repressor HrcA C-terminal domain-containing protein n=1 Tax=Candidatus Falkowbacteria bacterium CG10_big_fil_rev_8_21_14_0_10_43_10 TaxID=1974567 RepID=A0A2H0V2F8_9BACT|nr:MAG: hypothetical protein COT99_01830 [Candidatus Falkowbacteria bacterium CG10_big_fil_rev_8_21_14_0_10_43_10]